MEDQWPEPGELLCATRVEHPCAGILVCQGQAAVGGRRVRSWGAGWRPWYRSVLPERRAIDAATRHEHDGSGRLRAAVLMLALTSAHRYLLRKAPTDMRKGFDSLCGLVRGELGRDPLSGEVFV